MFPRLGGLLKCYRRVLPGTPGGVPVDAPSSSPGPAFARRSRNCVTLRDFRIRERPGDARPSSVRLPRGQGSTLETLVEQRREFATVSVAADNGGYSTTIEIVCQARFRGLGSGCGFRGIGRVRKRQRRTRAWGFFRLTPRRTYASSADIRTPHATVPPSAG